MYHEKLAIAVMHGNNVLREVGDRVYLPFGSEYKLRIKNLHSKKAIINIFIDGTNVTEGGLVVYSNSTLDLERFIKSGNLTTGNRFKFIARSAAVSKHRGNKSEDGLIRIEYGFEKKSKEDELLDIVKQLQDKVDNIDRNTPKQWPWGGYNPNRVPMYGLKAGDMGLTVGGVGIGVGGIGINGTLNSSESVGLFSDSTEGVVNLSQVNGTLNATAQSLTTNNAGTMGYITPAHGVLRSRPAPDSMVPKVKPEVTGITAPGSISNQQFVLVDDFEVEENMTMILRLVGEVEEKKVEKPVTVKSNITCTMCGLKSKPSAKFCSRCSASLTIV